MKKLFLSLTLLASFATMAQDGYSLTPETYQGITAKVSQLDTLSARAFADRLAGSATTSFAYMQTKTNETGTKFYYSRTDLTQKEQLDQEEIGCTSCLVVYFKNTADGLTFNQVVGSFEDLLPTWQREFLPTATADNAQQSFKYREVKNRATGTNIRFEKFNNMWQIYNSSK